MKEIPLSRGLVAIVDDEDFEYLSQWKWHLFRTKDGDYATRNIRLNSKRTKIRMHTQLMTPPDGLVVDHRNGDGLDNRRSNLRVCTLTENNCNRRGSGASKYLGVSYKSRQGKYTAQIYQHGKGKQIHLGSFLNEIDAARAYDRIAPSIHGEFARLNFPQEAAA